MTEPISKEDQLSNLQYQNKRLHEKVLSLQQENTVLLRRIIDKDYEIISLQPRKSEIRATWRKCNKRVLVARIIGTFVAILLITIFLMNQDTLDIDSDLKFDVFVLFIPILIGWKCYQRVKYTLLKQPAPKSENIWFAGLFMAAITTGTAGLIVQAIPENWSSLAQMAAALMLVVVTLILLLLVIMYLQRKLKREAT